MKKNILIISAHSDDNIICAGSVFKLQDQGYNTYEILLTNSAEGNDRRNGKVLTDEKEVVRLRTNEFSKASKLLDLKQKFVFGEEDLNLKYAKKLMFKIMKVIREIKPDVIFTMNEYDYHPDHRAAAKLTMEASFWAATGVRPEYGHQHRTNTVLYGEGGLPLKPDVLVDITG